MTSPRALNRDELLELAALDAYGLLDEFEAEHFTRSFHHAPVGVQDEIRTLQAELVSDETILPDEAAPRELRDAVLRRVAEAIEDDSQNLAPLGVIGRRPARTNPLARRTPLTASGQFWRAACFVLAAAGLVLTYLLSVAVQSSNTALDLAMNANTAEIERLHGPTAMSLVLDHDRSVKMLPNQKNAEVEDKAVATLFLREFDKKDDGGEAFLVFRDLPRGNQYVLRAYVEGQTDPIVVRTVSSDGGPGGSQVLKLSAELFAATTWQIADTVTGAVIMTSGRA